MSFNWKLALIAAGCLVILVITIVITTTILAQPPSLSVDHTSLQKGQAVNLNKPMPTERITELNIDPDLRLFTVREAFTFVSSFNESISNAGKRYVLLGPTSDLNLNLTTVPQSEIWGLLGDTKVFTMRASAYIRKYRRDHYPPPLSEKPLLQDKLSRIVYGVSRATVLDADFWLNNYREDRTQHLISQLYIAQTEHTVGSVLCALYFLWGGSLQQNPDLI